MKNLYFEVLLKDYKKGFGTRNLSEIVYTIIVQGGRSMSPVFESSARIKERKGI